MSECDKTRQEDRNRARQHEAEQAVVWLIEARRIRQDAELMLRVREYLRDRRDEMAGLLDDIG